MGGGIDIGLILLGAVLLDRVFGEPRRWHPLVGFGRLAGALEGYVNRGGARRWKGLAAWLVMVLPGVALAAWLALQPYGAWLEVLVLYLALGATALGQHAEAVRRALLTGDLARARACVGRMVSRDTHALDAPGVARAAVESVLENGNDAVFGALVWFVVGGAGGVVLYRLANTLDAMWGYRSPRYRAFGWAAARLDDALNFVPARLTALTYGLLGDFTAARRCRRRQGRAWDSPNAGPVMAAGAGALGVRLGGAAQYHGAWRDRPQLGEGAPAGADDIGRATQLVTRGLWAWVVVIALGTLY